MIRAEIIDSVAKSLKLTKTPTGVWELDIEYGDFISTSYLDSDNIEKTPADIILLAVYIKQKVGSSGLFANTNNPVDNAISIIYSYHDRIQLMKEDE